MTSCEKTTGASRSDRGARVSYPLFSFVVTIVAYTVQPAERISVASAGGAQSQNYAAGLKSS
jgi:hypothetical protein